MQKAKLALRLEQSGRTPGRRLHKDLNRQWRPACSFAATQKDGIIFDEEVSESEGDLYE